jgi:hypothetical protein
MRKNILAIGERTVYGDVGRLMIAGEVHVVNADVKKVYGAGELSIENSYIEKFRAAGDITANNTRFDDFKSAGDVKLTGDCLANIFASFGTVEAENLECNILKNGSDNVNVIRNGKQVVVNKQYHIYKNSSSSSDNYLVEFKGKYKAQTFENFLPFTLTCKFEFRNILSKKLLIYDGVLECERLYSFGSLQMEGVNAERIYIKTNIDTKLESVVGTKIVISDKIYFDNEFKAVPKTTNEKDFSKDIMPSKAIMEISQIEGDDIVLDNVKANSVCGINVTIGDMCIIERVEYKDKINISKKAIVNEVVKI